MSDSTEPLVLAADELERRVGLRTTGATRPRLESCLRHRSSVRGVELSEYVRQLRSEPAELQLLVDVLTVQETSFFRDPQHFEALTHHVIARHQGPVTIWSAGCATGAEPYSIAMALDEVGVTDFRVIATDLSRLAVERTAEAAYSDSELRGLSAARRGRYLVCSGSRWLVDPALRERVVVRHHNLFTDPIPVGAGEAIAVYCRNVMIYADRARIDPFLRRLRSHVAPGGVVFLGATESMARPPEGWSLAQLGSAFAYRATEPDSPGTSDAGHSPPPSASARPRPATVERPSSRPAGNRPDRQTSRAEDISGGPDSEPVSDVSTWRRAVYLSPDDALAHLELALALDAAGDARAGQRSYRAARAALERADPTELEHRLEGYGLDTLRSMLDAKLSEGESCR